MTKAEHVEAQFVNLLRGIVADPGPVQTYRKRAGNRASPALIERALRDARA